MNANNSELHAPTTLMEAVQYFADPETAHKFFVNVRWHDGVVCPTCGSTEASYNPKYRRFQCNRKHDRRQFTVKTGSVMEDSPLSLHKWAVAFWLEVNAKNSISSYEIHRALGITQKSAWFMLHRIRLAIQQGGFEKLDGVVEADETFIGGLSKNMHKHIRARKIKGGGGGGKAVVAGILERHTVKKSDRKTDKRRSRVIAKVVEDRTMSSLHPVVLENVAKNATVYTDACLGYNGLSTVYTHEFVDHIETYVRGAVHTNGMENFWSLFKRCIKGTHVSVEPYHLEAYVDSEAFRFNNRAHTDGERFIKALGGAAGKRITYKALIGKDDSEGALGSDSDGESENAVN